MTILQVGKAKSGNYWLYKTLQYALNAGGIETRSHVTQHPIHDIAKEWQLSHDDQANMDVLSIEPEAVYFRIGDRFREEIHDVDAYIDKCSHAWTHSFFLPGREDFYRKFDKMVYMIRDPRDVAISMARFAFTPYMLAKGSHSEPDEQSYLDHRLYGSVLSWVRHVAGYLKAGRRLGMHFIFFERMKRDFDREVGSLLSYLGLDLNRDQVRELAGAVSLGRMRQENPQHVRKGEIYQWINRLTDEQKRQVLRIAAPMLELFNYPIADPIEGYPLPSFPGAVSERQVDDIVAVSRGTLRDKALYTLSFLRSRRPLKEKVEKGLGFLFGRPVQ